MAWTGNDVVQFKKDFDGRRHLCFFLRGTDVQTSDEVEIDLDALDIGPFLTVTEFRASSGAGTIQPSLKARAGATGVHLLRTTAEAAQNVKNAQPASFIASTGKLYISPNVSANGQTVEIEFSLVEGHHVRGE